MADIFTVYPCRDLVIFDTVIVSLHTPLYSRCMGTVISCSGDCVCLSLCLSLSKRKMDRAVNAKVSTHVLYMAGPLHGYWPWDQGHRVIKCAAGPVLHVDLFTF